MPSTISLAITAMLAACALAAPFPSKALSKRGSFTVPVRARKDVRRSPRKELERTYAKYGWDIVIIDPFSTASDTSSGDASSSDNSPWPWPFGGSSEASSSVAAPAATSSAVSGSNEAASTTAAATASSSTAASSSGAETGQVSAVPESNDSEYLESVQIGTSAQTLNLDFDTGSADFWVFSSSLASSESSGHTVFNPSKSSTWTDYSAGSWQISYGDGSSASGTVGFDKVNIGGATATKQAIELATTVSGSFVSDTANDGLVGLAFSSINTVQPQQQSTFFKNVQDQLASYVFTANLKDSSAGSYTFGEIDSSQYTGSIHYTDVDNSQGFWSWTPASYSIGGSSSACQTCSPSIADTGTSLLLVDEEIVKAFYAQVNGAQYDSTQGGYVYPCSASLPSFGVPIGGWTATIPGSALTYAQIDSSNCFGGIQSSQGEGIQIYGDVLLKNFFAVFNGGTNQFGLATKA